MKQLWAPWRIEFIVQPKPTECILCLKPRENRDRENFILYRGRHCFVMMNIYPYNNGHLMISPYRHASTLEDLDNKVLADMMRVLKQCVKAIKQALSSDGINIGLNLGKIAGAGIENHLHFHIVPRWSGDTNFMAVMADVRVIPEHLKATYEKLHILFPKGNHRYQGIGTFSRQKKDHSRRQNLTLTSARKGRRK
jgi:ATP adenylyltransferase